MNPSDDENIYENITDDNNNGLNNDSSLNELQDLAIEINDSEIKIDLDNSQVPLENNDLYQFETTSNNEADTLYHEQLPYENTQDINFNTPNIEKTYSDIDEYTPNEITSIDYNDIPNEETQIDIEDARFESNNEQVEQNETLFEYNDDKTNETGIDDNDGIYAPVNETMVETPLEEEYTEEKMVVQEDDYTSSDNEEYKASYQDRYNQEEPNPETKKNFIPILMAIFAIIIFFVVLNLPQVKERISGIKSSNVENEKINELEELSNIDKQDLNNNISNGEKASSKRAKMVVFDEEKETGSNNVEICANPFLPTMNIDDGQDNSLGAYEIIVPPSGKEMENSVEVSTMMETKVSGILYDKDNPQAILNYNGQDQLVSRGDRLAGFYVMSITPDKVILKQGNNVYRVSVGQTVTDEGINYNVNSNLGKQFGGRYKNIKGNIINMNNDREK